MPSGPPSISSLRQTSGEGARPASTSPTSGGAEESAARRPSFSSTWNGATAASTWTSLAPRSRQREGTTPIRSATLRPLRLPLNSVAAMSVVSWEISRSSPRPSSPVRGSAASPGGSVFSASQTTSQPRAPGSSISAERPRISAAAGPALSSSFERRRKRDTGLLSRFHCSAPQRRRRNPGLSADLGQDHGDLVDEAPRPFFRRLQGADDRVAVSHGVTAGMPVGGVVAAADLAALQADAQVEPFASAGEAVLAACNGGRQLGHVHVIEMCAGRGHGEPLPELGHGLGDDDGARGLDQGQVGEGLGKIPQEAAGSGIELLGIETEGGGDAKQPLHQVAGALHLADDRQGGDEPERADQEAALLAGEAIVRLVSPVAQHEAALREVLVDRLDRFAKPLVVSGQEAEERGEEGGGVE